MANLFRIPLIKFDQNRPRFVEEITGLIVSARKYFAVENVISELLTESANNDLKHNMRHCIDTVKAVHVIWTGEKLG